VEVTQELWAVVLDDQDDSHCCFVKLSKRLGHWLSYYHIALEEEEKVNNELLKLEPLLEIVIALLLLGNLKLCLNSAPFFISLSLPTSLKLH
jgi:hypothetical protein